MFFLDLSAKAKVKKYKTKTDPKFQFTVLGIKNGYKNNEGIQFTVEPYLDAYVTIFYIEKKKRLEFIHLKATILLFLWGRKDL